MAPIISGNFVLPSGGDLSIAYSDRFGCYRHQRSQRTYRFKKRFFDLNCVKNFGGKDRNLAPKEDINIDVSGKS